MNSVRISSFILTGLLVALQGCAQQPVSLAGDGGYCDKIRGFKTCIGGPLPSTATEIQAKQFTPRPDAITVFLVRNRLNDRPGLVTVTLDGGLSMATVPHSLVRLTLPPGNHRLSLIDHGQRYALDLVGSKGEVKFAQIVLTYGFVDYGYRLRLGETADSMRRAESSKLIADISG